VHVVRAVHGEASIADNLIPEFERCIAEAQPIWFLMENVEGAPLPSVPGYIVHDAMLNNRLFGAEQNRTRRFSFGTRDGRRLSARVIADCVAPIAGTWEAAVCSTAGGRRASLAMLRNGKVKGNQGRSPNARLKKRTIAHEAELQGLPPDFLAEAPFTAEGKRTAIGNGVPLPMGRAIAGAVREALTRMEAPDAA
jgi:DNA (cytosine-5)-methyltransferase 1